MTDSPVVAGADYTPPSRLLRMPAVVKSTGLTRDGIYYLIALKQFPKPVRVRIGGRAVAWHEHEVEDWKKSRPPVEDFKPRLRRGA